MKFPVGVQTGAGDAYSMGRKEVMMPRFAQFGLLRDVFLAFLKLGLTCFGGPVAHLGYFRTEFVERRRWLDEASFADLVACCQFLPGPASSQTGMAIGLLRGGYAGGLVAWVGFTLPSAVLMLLFAYGAPGLAVSPAGMRLLHGLKLVAAAIVAQAVWSMARSLCRGRARVLIAVVAMGIALLGPVLLRQIGAIAMGALAGMLFCRTGPVSPLRETLPLRSGLWAGGVSLGLFAVLLLFLPSLGRAAPAIAMFNAFYRSGALVFGGGHVVLPLLNQALVPPGWVSESAFLAGYGAAQAVPGPLFTFAAYLGAVMPMPFGGVPGALAALVAIFLPGALLLTGTLPFWNRLTAYAPARSAMNGVQAAVVGLLAAALYDPVLPGAVHNPMDVVVVLAGFALLVFGKAPPLLVVILGAASGIGGL